MVTESKGKRRGLEYPHGTLLPYCAGYCTEISAEGEEGHWATWICYGQGALASCSLLTN